MFLLQVTKNRNIKITVGFLFYFILNLFNIFITYHLFKLIVLYIFSEDCFDVETFNERTLIAVFLYENRNSEIPKTAIDYYIEVKNLSIDQAQRKFSQYCGKRKGKRVSRKRKFQELGTSFLLTEDDSCMPIALNLYFGRDVYASMNYFKEMQSILVKVKNFI